MVESAEDRQAHDLHPTFGSVDFPAIRCVLAEREMGAGLVVVDAVGAKQVPCVSLVEDDHVVEYFSPDGADDAFGEGVLPGGPWRAEDLLEPESGDGLSDKALKMLSRSR
jgi:hypothetical protein